MIPSRKSTAGLLVLALLCLLSVAGAALGEIRISGDLGGDMATYMQSFGKIRDSGKRVVIDGDCFSSCTLVTAYIPKQRVCVTKRARLGFHAVQRPDEHGRMVDSPALTRVLMDLYPPVVQRWLKRNGGLSSSPLIMQGEELGIIYQPCG